MHTLFPSWAQPLLSLLTFTSPENANAPPSTPTHTYLSEDHEDGSLVGRILKIHQELSATDLKPSPKVNKLFGELVAISTRTLGKQKTAEILDNARIKNLFPSLHEISSTAESYLESNWAELVAGGEAEEDPREVLERLKFFPYFTNYTDLTSLELSAIHTTLSLTSSSSTNPPSQICKIAFIGSGPLPLTSLCLSGLIPLPGLPSSNIEILNIDNSASAITTSSHLCHKLGISGSKMRFLHRDASEISAGELADCDVVFLAALVGSNQVSKEQVLMKVVSGMRAGAILVVRGAERGRCLLYPEFDPTTEAVRQVLEVVMVVHPYNHIVNSVIVGRARAGVGGK